jgi:hypothetical protein
LSDGNTSLRPALGSSEPSANIAERGGRSRAPEGALANWISEVSIDAGEGIGRL